MLAKLLLALSVAAAAHAITLAPGDSVSCENGLFCAKGQTCMSKGEGAGAKLACSPHPNAVVCNDKRFSCPAGSTCFNQLCTPVEGGEPFEASTSLDAESVGLRTYGDGVYILPTDAPGLKGIDSDICNRVNPILPSFCNCSVTYGVTCQVYAGEHFSAFINARFMPCGASPTISYSWGAGIFGRENDVASGSQQFNASYNKQTFPIPGTDATFFGSGLYAGAVVSGSVNNTVMSANVGLDICGTINFIFKKISGCASDSSFTTRVSKFLGVPGARPPFLIA